MSAKAIQRTRLASNKHCLRLPSFLFSVSSNQSWAYGLQSVWGLLHLHIGAKENLISESQHLELNKKTKEHKHSRYPKYMYMYIYIWPKRARNDSQAVKVCHGLSNITQLRFVEALYGTNSAGDDTWTIQNTTLLNKKLKKWHKKMVQIEFADNSAANSKIFPLLGTLNWGPLFSPVLPFLPTCSMSVHFRENTAYECPHQPWKHLKSSPSLRGVASPDPLE